MSRRHITALLLLTTTVGLHSTPLLAAPDEIQVYTDEMDIPGKFGVEMHVNYAMEGAKTASYAGELPGNHVLQMTPEFSYGVTDTLEAGLYLPFALTSDGYLYNNGLRLRLKYIASHEEIGFFWGLNTELGYFDRRISESKWAMELRPIIGVRTENWLVSFNPILDLDLSSNVSNAPQFEPGLKVMRSVTNGFDAGVEYYGSYGPLHELDPASQRSQALYLAADVEFGEYDINFGIGRGFDNNPDKWVAKAIIAFPF